MIPEPPAVVAARVAEIGAAHDEMEDTIKRTGASLLVLAPTIPEPDSVQLQLEPLILVQLMMRWKVVPSPSSLLRVDQAFSIANIKTFTKAYNGRAYSDGE